MIEKREKKAEPEIPIRLLEEQIVDELKIEEAQLQKELKNQPSRFFHWARLWARASIVKKMSWLRLEETEARIAKEFGREIATPQEARKILNLDH